jgi:DNA-binding transcriptional LysR family regulator
MDLRHLRYFIAVAENLHFAQAAEQLGVSAPTLTVQIQQLEHSLQARLFHRTKRSVALTSAGEAFLAEARGTLEQFDRALNVGRRAGRGELGRIEVGYVGSAVFSGLLQEQLRRFRLSWPAVLLHAKELPMHQLVPLIDDGRIDIAFVRPPVELTSSVRSHVLMRDTFCAALPAEHRLAGHPGPIRSKELAGESFIVPEQALGTQEVGRRGRFIPRIADTPGSLLAVLTQVSLGAGVAIVPTVVMAVVNLPNVVLKRVAGDPILSEVAAIFRKHERSPPVKNLIDQIVQVQASVAARVA